MKRQIASPALVSPIKSLPPFDFTKRCRENLPALDAQGVLEAPLKKVRTSPAGGSPCKDVKTAFNEAAANCRNLLESNIIVGYHRTGSDQVGPLLQSATHSQINLYLCSDPDTWREKGPAVVALVVLKESKETADISIVNVKGPHNYQAIASPTRDIRLLPVTWDAHAIDPTPDERGYDHYDYD